MPDTVVVAQRPDAIPSLSLALEDPAATEIVLEPGVYVEHVVVGPRERPLRIRSETGRAEDVTISFGLHQGARDETGMPFGQRCATLTIEADDVTLEDLTVVNTFDKREHPDWPETQALALRTLGDRVRVERCRLLARQDTVLLDAPSWAAVRRVHLRDCEIEGDVDFLYGRATALIEGGIIRSNAPGYLVAPSTALENPRGFLIVGARLEATPDVPAGSVRLGRPWHPGGKPDAVGQAIFSRCVLGAHIAADPWDEMGGFPWQEARFAEFASTGPGASGRGPQLAEEPDAASWLDDPTPAPSLRPTDASSDRPTTGAATPPRLVVLSDSTASPYPPERAPREGWGMRLGEETGAEVLNRAISGESTRSFIESGALESVLEELAPGDVVLVGFGHNDPKPDHRFADVVSAHPANLRRFLVGIRARGARPVLLTPIERRAFADGRLVPTHGGYPQSVRRLAVREGVPLIDLSILTGRLWEADGEEGSKASFLHLEPGAWPGYPDGEADDTHLSALGASRVAALVADGLRDLGLL
ncbi:pectinesterase family protein [Brachybacterium sp. DNPG3]